MANGRVGLDRSAACRMVLESSIRSSGLLWEKSTRFLNSVVRLKWKLMSVAKIAPITIFLSSCFRSDVAFSVAVSHFCWTTE